MYRIYITFFQKLFFCTFLAIFWSAHVEYMFLICMKKVRFSSRQTEQKLGARGHRALLEHSPVSVGTVYTELSW